MRKYEIMLILPAEADDKVVGGVTDRIAQVVAASGGQVGKVDRWGRRRLTYELDRHTEGFYLIVEFTADPAALRELDRVLTLADEVLRFKVVVPPETAGKAPKAQPETASGARPSVQVAEPAAAPAEAGAAGAA